MASKINFLHLQKRPDQHIDEYLQFPAEVISDQRLNENHQLPPEVISENSFF